MTTKSAIIPFTICRKNWLLCFVVIAVFFAKFINTTGGIDKLLLAREKRVALRTYFNSDIAYRCASFKLVTACASHSSRFIVRMNSLFHFIPP
jgi:hypothetical protein